MTPEEIEALIRQLSPGLRVLGNPCMTRAAALARAVKALEGGATLRGAAEAAGVHVATLCRWRLRSEDCRRKVDQALEWSRRVRRNRAAIRRTVRSGAPWRRDCPKCGAALEVRKARKGGRFWRCSAGCGWASWRRPHPDPCPRCGGLCFWSYTLLMIGCSACGHRRDGVRRCWPSGEVESAG